MLHNFVNSLCRCRTNRTEFRRHRHWKIHRWANFQRWQDFDRDREKEIKETQLQRRWSADGSMFITPENPKDALPYKDPEDETRCEKGGFEFDHIASHSLMRYLDYSRDNLRRYNRYKNFLIRQYDQRFIPERHLFLGVDLAAAHFLVHRGAAVKFVDDDVWHKKDTKGRYKLPGRRIPGMHLEAIDASNTELMFEGNFDTNEIVDGTIFEAFDNLVDLRHLRMLRLAGCPHIGDWAMGRMTAFDNSLEFLDLSGCTRLSARGLAGLRSLKHLKYLRLEGMDNVANISKTALLLETVIPNLHVIGLDYDRSFEELDVQKRLLSHDKIVHDARGNIHVEDDNGQLYYIGGGISEKPVVDDEDLPLVVSLIRKDVPSLSTDQLTELDNMSGGKLRHLLIGSPSGLSWGVEVERTLSFETKWKTKEKVNIHPFMLIKKDRNDRRIEGEDETSSFLQDR